MSAPHENNPVNQEVAARQEAANRKSGEELARELLRVAAKADEAKRAFDEAVKQNKNAAEAITGSKQDKDSLKGKANDVKQTLQEVLLKAKGGKVVSVDADAITPKNEFAQAALKQVAEKIGDVGSLSEESALQLSGFVSKIVDGTITDAKGLEQEFKNIKNLKTASQPLYEQVQQALVKTVQEKAGMTEQEAKQRFDVVPPTQAESSQDNQKSLNKEEMAEAVAKGVKDAQPPPTHRDVFEVVWQQHGFKDYFSENDKELARACYETEDFKNYIKEQKRLLVESNPQKYKDVNNPEVGKIVSTNFEKDVVGLFGKLYNRLDHERPSEFFEQIEQQDVMRGILPVKNLIKRRLSVIALELQAEGHDDLGLFKGVEDRSEVMDVPFEVEVTNAKGEKVKEVHYKPRMRIHPYPILKPTEGGAFLHHLDQTIDTYIEARKYTHNARAIFLHPVDPEKGFYSQLKQFSESMTTPDFDAIFLLPDADIFQTALQLYDKHIDEMFAKNDWRHAATAFQSKLGDVRNEPEQDVLNQLKIMFHGKVSEERLQAATTMAVGAARGMFLTEIEKAAYADPHLGEDGTFTYGSYYTNDNDALKPFNPMHHFYRFQGVRTTDPILFLPVEGMDKTKSVFSDHNDLWKKMLGYREAFLTGRGGKGSKIPEGEQLFADFVVNFGRIGGPMERRGWRTNMMFENLYYYDTKGENTEELKSKVKDHLKSFMRIENIGYEAVQHFIGSMDKGFMEVSDRRGLSETDKRYITQKKALFAHVYEKYFGRDLSTLDSFVNQIRKEQGKKVWDNIKSGKQPPTSIEAEIETQTTKEFLNRALVRLVAQRMPSKILRIDRDRFSTDGESRWRKLAKEMFPKSEIGDKQTRDFDKVVRDLLFAEQLLRAEVSNQMRDMKSLPEKQHWKWGEIDYNLTQEKIRQLFQAKPDYDEARINQMCKLLGLIETNYVRGKTGEEFLDKKLIKIVREGAVAERESYRFTFGLEELAMEFVPWRAAGNRMLARAMADISTVEQTMSKEIIKLPAILHQMAIDGKADFTPVLDMLSKMYGSMEGIIGPDYAHRVVHHVAAMTINYFKKDPIARAFYGLFGNNRKNSLAAERAGSGLRVWEWDSTTIDRFCIAIESRGLLPTEPYSTTNPKVEYLPRYINLPFVNKPIKLPDKINLFGKDIPLFRQRKVDFQWTIKRLRDEFGGNPIDVIFDYINKYIPFFLAFLFWKYIQDALKESEGKKK